MSVDHHGHTAEEMKRQYEEMKANNLDKLKNIEFERDENGQTTYLGMPVSEEMRPVLETAINGIKPYIIGYSENVSSAVAKAAHKIGFKKSSATVGLVAENIFRWGIVGTEQIFHAIKASNKYARERKELFVTLSPVMQATGSNLHNNEVIKAAYDEIHADWASEMTKMVADVPSLIPTFYSAWQDQKASSKKRKADVAKKIDITDEAAYDARQKHDDKLADERFERGEALERRIDVRRQKIIDSHGDGDPDGLARKLETFRNGTENTMRNDFYNEGRNYGGQEEYEHKVAVKNNGDATGLLMAGGTVGSIVSQMWKHSIDKGVEQRKKRVKAWRLIENLKTEMDAHCADKRGRSSEYDDCEKSFTSRSPEDITISGKGNKEGESLNLKQYIIEVFQQHERDREPNRSFYDAKTGKAIDPLKGTMLNNLTPLVDVIAEHIADGTLSGDALYKLVGENRVIQHSASGARVFAKAEALNKMIDEELSPVLGTREVMKMEEFTAKFPDPKGAQEMLKKNLAGMQGVTKAVFAAQYPDDILVQSGMAKADVFPMRKQAHEKDRSIYFAAVMASHFAKRSDEELKKLGVPENEAKALRSLAEKVDGGDMKELKLAVHGSDKSAIDAIRTAGLLEQIKLGGAAGEAFWKDRTNEITAMEATFKKNVAANKDNKESADASASAAGADAAAGKEEGAWSKKHPAKPRTGLGDSSAMAEPSTGGYSSRFEAPAGGYSGRERTDKKPDHSVAI